MPREPIVKKLVAEILLDRGPLAYSELMKALRKTLRRKVMEGTLTWALKSLEREGVVEKLPDGRWIAGKGYPLYFFKEKLAKSFHELELKSTLDYGIFLLDPNLDPFIEHELRRVLLDECQDLVAKLYITLADILLQASNRRKDIAEAILKITYLGYLDAAQGKKKVKNIEECDDATIEMAFMNGIHIAGAHTLSGFLANLWEVGAIYQLIERVHHELKRWPNQSLEDLKEEAPKLAILLERELFGKMVNLRLAAIIYLDRSVHDKMLGLLYRFERWLEALKRGVIDYRDHIWEEAPNLLARMIRWLQGKASLKEHREIEEILDKKIDGQEPWTLRDLYEHHPRGRDPKLYQMILEEIELRRRPRERRNH